MGIVFNDIISSIVYLFIWISFWGIIDTLIIKYVTNIDSKLKIYVSMLILSCLIYAFVLNKNINISKKYQQEEKIVKE
jgi:hypothetical protein